MEELKDIQLEIETLNKNIKLEETKKQALELRAKLKEKYNSLTKTEGKDKDENTTNQTLNENQSHELNASSIKNLKSDQELTSNELSGLQALNEKMLKGFKK